MEKRNTDVLVLGGGAAGVNASIAAARHGLEVVLIESQGCLGGSRTAAGVDTFYGFYTPGENQKRIVGGIPWEIAQKLSIEHSSFERPNTYGAGTGITYDVEKLKITYENMVLEAGVKLLFHTYACQVNVEDHHIMSVVIANKSGLTEISAKFYIDTTGDGDIAARSGAPFDKADSEDLQSLTTIFFMANVDVEKAKSIPHQKMADLMKEANRSGTYKLPREDGSWHRTPNKGVIQCNMVRVSGVDATDPFALTLAEVEGRKQAQEYARFLKEYISGFEQSFLIATSQHIGVRETRRILGEYILTEEDVVRGAKFEDAIACCSAPVEDHHSGSGTRWAYVKGDGIYHIPYKSLVPQNIENLIVAGRCLSATHGAQASARNSAQCMAMGQAAGVAASLCAEENSSFRTLNVKRLQRRLLEQQAII
ncbi:FAD-dependent oxidoreductase [Fictibacillus terranigra]|uniref:FAD-dependent oxidoreductase n=1 Tax=Fictibacillus terranigra TaxID=3058424 RepID=A0ABT8EDL3_9BACL|nr:FAD-dependent oxidoreductase [Fictibacillus sp. CENA-BCM004]MDN4076018.1 FAD-dependent oxidoreductase [Fictibacillus sp. CENA-BCM004]